MKEKVQSILSWEERVSSCTLSTGLPGRCIVVAIPCGRHAWAAHYPRFHLQCHSPAKSVGRKRSCNSPGAQGNRHSLQMSMEQFKGLHIFSQYVNILILTS